MAVDRAYVAMPGGFTILITHSTGAPAEEWDRLARLLTAAPKMRDTIAHLILMLQTRTIRDTITTQEIANARTLLAEIEGQA